MSIFRRLFGNPADRASVAPLYQAIVASARDPIWYREGAVPDTIDGRFDMVAAILSLVLIRLDAAGEAGRSPAALVTEQFVDDMDGQLRELGIGDVIVGKHVGKLMGALGGRLDAYRRTIGGEGDANGDGLEAAIARNVYRDAPPPPEVLASVAARMRRFAAGLAALPDATLIEGRLPTP
ncbi:MAG: ubiquinol-cytochrome chaperone [Sphingomonas bacterium]|nr:ubiquinol-cytochrome chaperone [Sphingomonas bacterium]